MQFVLLIDATSPSKEKVFIMTKRKLSRAAKYFEAQASKQMHALRSEGFGLDNRQGEFWEIKQQIDWLESVITGISEFLTQLKVTKALECRERTAMRTKPELVRYLADLHLDMLDTDVASAQHLYAARTFVLQQRQPMLSIFTFDVEPAELVTQ